VNCANPGHAAAGTSCAACAKACQAELTALNDRYMRVLGDRSERERGMKAVFRSQYQDDLNTFGGWYAAAAMSRALGRLARVAALASNLTPGMALARHREAIAAVRQAGAEALSWQGGEAAGAERLWGEWRAENTRLRALVRQAGRALHARHGTPAGGCRCDGCEVIRDMDAVPVTAEDGGLPDPAAVKP
jgi:hypothetical protein